MRIITVGRLHWVKGIEYALHAIRALCDAGHRVSYSIVGADDGAAEAIRLAIRDLRLEEMVTLLGHVRNDDLRAVLAESDIFLLPSVSEGMCLAAMEAMSVGLPVIVTDVGGMSELVSDGVHGRLVPSRDSAAISTALVELMPPDVRDEMGRRASEHVRTHFDLSVYIDDLIASYEELTR